MIRLEDLGRLAGIPQADAERLLRTGRSNGRPESTYAHRGRVDAVTVLWRLEALLGADTDAVVAAAARLVHGAVENDLVGRPIALVAPVHHYGAKGVPRPTLSPRANVGALLGGRAGLVVDLGAPLGDWS